MSGTGGATKILVLIASLCLSNFGFVTSAKILFLFPLPLHSHFRAFNPMVEELAIRSHEITAYTAPEFKRKSPLQNYKEVLVYPIKNATIDLQDFDLLGMRKKSVFNYMHNYWRLSAMTEDALQTDALQSLMQSQEKFDLIIMEATFVQESLLAFGHKFGAPVINLHPISIAPLMATLTGTPNPFSYVPDFRLPFTDRMSFWQKVHNTILGVYELMGGTVYYLPYQDNMMRTHFKYAGSETLPSVKELIANVSLHLIDSHPMLYTRPYSPNVIDVAGMRIKHAGQLPEDLQKFMDEATNGVIYFSFGSFIDPTKLPEHVKKVFVEAMKKLKQRIIWKWTDRIDGEATHILQGSWFPQPEILAHPNCKLFITHGGFNSLVETVSIGVPVLGFPIFADQYHNVAYYEHMGVGVGANIDSLSVQEFTEKIEKIIYTPSFTENSKKLSNIFRDMPQTSLEKAVFWVEYVIRHKGAHHLKPASVNLPLYKYLLLDVIAFCVISVFLVVYVFLWTVRKIVCRVQRSSHKGSENKILNKKRD